MTNLKELMSLEERILNIDTSFEKFNLNFNDLLLLKKYKEELSKITDLYFKTQVDYANAMMGFDKYEEELKTYHDKLLYDEIEFDIDPIVGFLERIE